MQTTEKQFSIELPLDILLNEALISKTYYACRVKLVVSAIFITISSLALAGMLLPNSPLGHVLIGFGQKALLGISASFGPFGIILLGYCIKALAKIREREREVILKKIEHIEKVKQLFQKEKI